VRGEPHALRHRADARVAALEHLQHELKGSGAQIRLSPPVRVRGHGVLVRKSICEEAAFGRKERSASRARSAASKVRSGEGARRGQPGMEAVRSARKRL
jgi:hypothetical protein